MFRAMYHISCAADVDTKVKCEQALHRLSYIFNLPCLSFPFSGTRFFFRLPFKPLPGYTQTGNKGSLKPLPILLHFLRGIRIPNISCLPPLFPPIINGDIINSIISSEGYIIQRGKFYSDIMGISMEIATFANANF